MPPPGRRETSSTTPIDIDAPGDVEDLSDESEHPGSEKERDPQGAQHSLRTAPPAETARTPEPATRRARRREQAERVARHQATRPTTTAAVTGLRRAREDDA